MAHQEPQGPRKPSSRHENRAKNTPPPGFATRSEAGCFTHQGRLTVVRGSKVLIFFFLKKIVVTPPPPPRRGGGCSFLLMSIEHDIP